MIYIIEDDENIRNLVEVALKGSGYETAAFETAEEALGAFKVRQPQLAIFDLMLPGMDGMEAIRKIREQKQWKKLPVLVLTAKDKEYDKVAGLDGGADDYMTKPFSVLELLARVRTAIRHARGAGNGQGGTQAVTFLEGRLVIDHDKHRVFVDGEDAGLTQNEFKLVSLLGKYAGKVLTYDYMMKEIWGPNMKNDNRILRVNMANIRRKIEKNPAQPEFIFTEIGVGYRFVEADVQAKEKK